MYRVRFTKKALETIEKLKNSPSDRGRYKAVVKSITLLSQDPHHNSLQTHSIHSIRGPAGQKVFEAYAQQKTPAAYRIFWYYGPDHAAITVFAVTPHP